MIETLVTNGLRSVYIEKRRIRTGIDLYDYVWFWLFPERPNHVFMAEKHGIASFESAVKPARLSAFQPYLKGLWVWSITFSRPAISIFPMATIRPNISMRVSVLGLSLPTARPWSVRFRRRRKQNRTDVKGKDALWG